MRYDIFGLPKKKLTNPYNVDDRNILKDDISKDAID